MTTDEGRCDLSDLLVTECGCRIHAPVVTIRYPEAVVTSIFPARFDSTLDCGHRANEGDPIGRTVEGDYICEGCAGPERP